MPSLEEAWNISSHPPPQHVFPNADSEHLETSGQLVVWLEIQNCKICVTSLNEFL